jgi:hypothetical protein
MHYGVKHNFQEYFNYIVLIVLSAEETGRKNMNNRAAIVHPQLYMYTEYTSGPLIVIGIACLYI